MVLGFYPLFGGFFNLFLKLAGNRWDLWPLLALELQTWFLDLKLHSWAWKLTLELENLILELENLGLKTWFLGLSKSKEKEPNIPTIYGSAVGNWACWGKLNSMAAQIWRPKGWTVGYFTAFQ